MPRFDFQCRKCSAVFESAIPFGSSKRPACPACGAVSAQKLFTPPLGIVFKGKGWYKNDSRPAQAPAKKEEKKKETTKKEEPKKSEERR